MTDYREQISKAIDYIEGNLCSEELNIASIADVTGYSKYHFLRIFREVCGMTPHDYIRKRRISEIVKRMRNESGSISEIAFEFGFNSKENFSRAFKCEHGILPTQFKATDNSLKLYDRLYFELPVYRVDGFIHELESFQIVAYKCDEAEPHRFWNRYNAEERSCRLSGGRVVQDFGVSKWNDSLRKIDYYIGIRKTDVQGECSNTVTLNISGGLYAVFDTPPSTYFDFVNTIHNTWSYIGKVWLPENGYVRTGGYEIESYIEKSRTFSERIYIPIKKK